MKPEEVNDRNRSDSRECDPNERESNECDSSESSWDSAEEVDEEPEELIPTQCLFCTQLYSSVNEALDHIKAEHNFDTIKVCIHNKLDCIQFIKIINYIRTHKTNAHEVKEMIESRVWDKDDYMQPAIRDDPVLMFGTYFHI